MESTEYATEHCRPLVGKQAVLDAHVHLHRPQDSDGGGVVHDALPEDERVKDTRLLRPNHLQNCHRVCRRKDGAQSQAVLSDSNEL